MTEPVSFAVATPLVIGASDPVTLVLTNDSGGPLAVAAGKTTLTVTLGDLLGGGAASGVKVASTGWAATAVDHPAPSLVLTATSDDPIHAGDHRQITLDGISTAGSTRIATLTVTPQGLGTATEVQVVPAVVQATKPGAPLPVHAEVDPSRIPVQPADGPKPPISSSAALTMTYQATPGSGPLVDPHKPGARQFYLTAIYAKQPGRSALTSPALADLHGLQARSGKVYAYHWSVTPDKGFDPPRWKVHSTSPGVLDANDSVEIVLDNIVTDLAQGITSIYLQYTGMPGYKDGFVPFTVKKVAPKRGVVDLQLMSPAELHGDGQVLLAWTSYLTGADEWLQLGFTENGVPQTLTSKASQIPLQATQFRASARLLESADFTLAAYNGETQMNSKTQPVHVTAAPVVGDFVARPLVGMEQLVTLNWNLKAAETCVVSIDGFPGQVAIPVSGDGPLTTDLTLHDDPNGALASIGDHGSITLNAPNAPSGLTVCVTATTREEGKDVTDTAKVVIPLAPMPVVKISGSAVGDDLWSNVTLTWSAPGATRAQAYWDENVGREEGSATFGPVPLTPPYGGTTVLSARLEEGAIIDVTITAEGGWGAVANLTLGVA